MTLPMTLQGLTVCVAIAAALLAIWLYVRLGSYSPPSIGLTFANAGGAFLVLQFMPTVERLVAGGADALVIRKFGAVFLVVLPGLTYMWLASIWLIRLAQRSQDDSFRVH
jgi:hypothetical protein